MTRVFESELFVIVDKPVNWLTTPAREATDPRACLGRALQEEMGQQIYPVHRLDFEVSGLVMFAKTPAAHTAAQKWFEAGEVRKTYRALTQAHGEFPKTWTEWRSTLAKGKRRAFKAAHGKLSVTRARAEAVGEDLRWTLEPLTGRAHQLRFELSDRGWPIRGDVLYGGTEEDPAAGIALRAWALEFSAVGERLGLPLRIEGAALEFGQSSAGSAEPRS